MADLVVILKILPTCEGTFLAPGAERNVVGFEA